jgi:MFS family permease
VPAERNVVNRIHAQDLRHGAPPGGISKRGGQAAETSHRKVLPQTSAFWFVAIVLTLSLFAGTAPSPLYSIYEVQFRFSAATLTGIFAVYALAVLATLLVFGNISDHIGRRPVIVAALAVNACACALFLIANGVTELLVARVLQGIAVGGGIGALGGALIDLQPGESSLAPVINTGATSAGLATGALCTSALAQYAPAPTHLVWWLLLGALGLTALGILIIPESAKRIPGALASLRPRVSIPRDAKRSFVATTPCLVAAWALAGFYLSLGPSIFSQVIGSRNELWGGVMIFLLTGLGATSAVVFRSINPPTAMLIGCICLLVGATTTVFAIATATTVTVLIAASVSGVGFGTAFMGAFRTLTALAGPNDRAGLVAAIYTVTYIAFSVPALIAGVAVTHYGLHGTALVYCASIAAVAAAAVASMAQRRAPSRTSPDTTRSSMQSSPIAMPARTRTARSAQGEGLRQSRKKNLRVDPWLRRVRSVIPGGPQA